MDENIFENEGRGAVVSGFPMSPALKYFIDDVYPDAKQQRLMSMFFAGSPNGIDNPSDGVDSCCDDFFSENGDDA